MRCPVLLQPFSQGRVLVRADPRGRGSVLAAAVRSPCAKDRGRETRLVEGVGVGEPPDAQDRRTLRRIAGTRAFPASDRACGCYSNSGPAPRGMRRIRQEWTSWCRSWGNAALDIANDVSRDMKPVDLRKSPRDEPRDRRNAFIGPEVLPAQPA